jgi:MFS family permease
MHTPTTRFVRDRFTWQSYLMLTWFAFHQSGLGPLLPFLKDEMNLDYTVAAFHTSAFAIGALLVGILGDTLVHRWGRYTITWAGSIGLALSAVLLSFGQTPVLTITATFLLGFGGLLMIVSLQAALIDHHDKNRTKALAEMMAVSSLAAIITPLLVGGFESTGIGWRAMPIIGIVIVAVLLILYRNDPIPKIKASPNAAKRALPRLYWVYWSVMFLGIATGWCIGFWSAEFLRQEVGLETELAATLMSVYFAASAIGRFITSSIALRFEAEKLLMGWVLFSLTGFTIFWLAPVAWLNITGLFIAGLGTGNTVALVISAATQAIPDQVDAINARGALAGGFAILILPQTVGSAADVIGIKSAFGIVFVFLVMMVGAVGFINWLVSQRAKALVGESSENVHTEAAADTQHTPV